MSDEQKNKLLFFYAQNDLETIQNHEKYQEILKAHKLSAKLSKLDKEFEKIKKEITEIFHNNQNDSRLQVSSFLKYFYNLKDLESESLKYRKYMIQNSYYQNWNKKIQEYYDEKLEIILEHEYHYFISFSRSSTDEKLPNRVNKNYEVYIKGTLTDEIYKEEKISENLLAKAIYHQLEDRLPLHDGYIDYKHTKDKYDHHIQRACEKTIFFVQIIQNIMFNKKNNNQKENYCFKEFEFVQKGIKSTIQYIIAEGDRGELSKDKNLIFEKFIHWHKDIQMTTCIILDDTRVNIIEEKINELANNIENYIEDIFREAKEIKL